MKRAALILAAALAAPAAADEVVLRESVRLAADAKAVRLSDVAEISGPEALRLADTVVAEVADPAADLEITVAQVREALGAAGAHWGKVQLSGRAVSVRPALPSSASAPRLMTPVALDAAPKPGAAAPAQAVPPATAAGAPWEPCETLAELPTVRGAVARTLLGAWNTAPERMRLAFDPADRSVLDTPLDGARFEIQPLSELDSDRVEICLRAWSGARVERQHSLTVKPMVEFDAAVLRRDVGRGDMLREEDCLVEPRWVTPLQASTLCSLIEAVGRTADAPLKAGDVLKKKYFRRDMLIKRGDRVVVRCLVGGVVISMEAEARGDGVEGDSIELRKVGERETFMATVAGRGSAVIDLAR
jgi:flagella basal body P-ring formation protein FlgA